jgi:subtilisin family serine protease
MKPFSWLALVVATGVACAAPRTVATPAPAPAPSPVVPTPSAPAPAAPAIREAPRNWQLLDEGTDHVPGISAERAYREVLASRQPARSVIVAIIDSGIDTAHVDLKANLWSNAKEIAGNGRDDDSNGYTDDARGWNFIGGKDGRDVDHDTFEVTRLYARCNRASAGTTPPISADERARCDQVARDYEKLRTETEQTLAQVRQIDAMLAQVLPLLRQGAGTESLTVQNVSAIRTTRNDVEQARTIFLRLAADGILPKDIDEAKKEFESRLKYGLNPSYDPRPIVGDDYTNLAQRIYGNTDVVGSDAKHGTHVAGIIGAVRGNGIGVDGIAPGVRLLAVRAVPDGDERDKDIANAIRYAVDNGANVINMSFGKGYSPQKSAVDEAVKYADSKGVLIVHAAGNDGENSEVKPSFPTPIYIGGGKATNWIEVGASSWKMGDSLVAPFSNYGKTRVDVFAPGVDILSTVPGGGYDRESGTSMAAPVVTGLAALLMAYYPNLTAADVKRIILASATRHSDQKVLRPGGGEVPFSELSATGGIVNAYNALKMAQEQSATRP